MQYFLTYAILQSATKKREVPVLKLRFDAKWLVKQLHTHEVLHFIYIIIIILVINIINITIKDTIEK